MQFINYLSPPAQVIYKQLVKKITVVENSSKCLSNSDAYGWYSSSTKIMHICTSTILKNKSYINYFDETLLHESTHFAQHCKGNGIRMVKLGVNSIYLPDNKLKDVRNSLKYSSKEYYEIEKEAYFLEDKPKILNTFLKKYCF